MKIVIIEAFPNQYSIHLQSREADQVKQHKFLLAYVQYPLEEPPYYPGILPEDHLKIYEHLENIHQDKIFKA